LSLAQEDQGAAAAPAPRRVAGATTLPESENPERLFGKLSELDARVTKEDYFDTESKKWDLEGLRDDLSLAQEDHGAAAAPAHRRVAGATTLPENEDPERLFAQLSELDADAKREDYYDSGSMRWDLAGLRDDLDLCLGKDVPEAAESEAISSEDPETMLAKLKEFDPSVSKEDYFNIESMTWDLEGLSDDLGLAEEDQGMRLGAGTQASSRAIHDKTREVDVPPPAVAPAPAKAVPQSAVAAPQAPREEEAPSIKVGDFVQAQYEKDEGWYTGVIAKDNGDGSWVVKWDEPDEDVKESPVRSEYINVLPPAVVGDSVKAVWAEDGGWYDAEVQQINADGMVTVKYTEDQTVASVKADSVRKNLPLPRYWNAPYQPGDRAPKVNEVVLAYYTEMEEYTGWYTATVQTDNGDGTYGVRWIEDPSDSTLKREDIRLKTLRFSNDHIVVGQKYRAIVTNVREFGAFVDIGADCDGLVHVGKLADTRVSNPEEFVKKGQIVDVWFDRRQKDGKLSFAMSEKKLGDPWPRKKDVSGFVGVDSSEWLKGKVTGIESYGIFVEAASPKGGLVSTGLVPMAEIKGGSSEVKRGQEVSVCVKEVNVMAGRLILSMVGC